MGKSQETFSKKEKEKKRLQKRKEKEQRREERKANAKEGKSFEDMLAYVDENGNISSTPPDPSRKKTVRESDIVLGSRNIGGTPSPANRRGRVSFYNESKGFGFIRDSQSGDSVFFHSSSLTFEVREGDEVTFETQTGPKGAMAANVKKA
jgi:cold shock CspA family protein